MHLYFQNSFVSLSYDPESHLGIGKWKGSLQGPELREAFLLCLEMVNTFSLTRWLADDRLMGAIHPADQKWGLEVYVPRMAASSLQRFARLPSKHEANREAVKVMIDKGKTYKQSLAVRDFSDEKEALSWLMQPLP